MFVQYTRNNLVKKLKSVLKTKNKNRENCDNVAESTPTNFGGLDPGLSQRTE